MKKNKILAFLLSLSIVTCLLSNLNPKSSGVFAAREIFYGSLITVADQVPFAVFAVVCTAAFIAGIVLGIRGCSTEKIPNNNKIENDFRLCEKIKLKR